jgi:sterol 3beta-glucosyltransferase
MRITLLAVGSRGDVQPLVALGLGLLERGHRVRLATHGEFRELAESVGLETRVLGGLSIPALMHEMTAHAGRRAGGRLFLDFLPGLKHLRAGMAPLLDDCLHAVSDADAVGFSPQLLSLAGSLAETGRRRLFCTCLQPVIPTAAFPSPFLGLPSLGARLNRAGYTLPARLFWPFVGSVFNQWRRRSLGLAPVGAAQVARWLELPFPVLCGFSGRVVPPPTDWGSDRVCCGYWRLPASAGGSLSPQLERFLAEGDPPVAVGFGSMADPRGEAALSCLLQALDQLGLRAVIQTPLERCGGRPLPDSAFRADGLDHRVLYPRVRAVVHHCGAGTAAAVLHAGVPSLPVPFAFEQPWWARRLLELGVATPALPRHRLRTDRLVGALERVCRDTELRESARRIADELNREDGVQQAVDALEGLFPH